MTTSSPSTTHIGRIGTVCIAISDVDRAIDFYVGKLGLEKRVDVPFGGDYRWVEVAPAGRETTIALAPPPPGQEIVSRDTGIALSSDDIEATYDALREGGVDVDTEISRMGDPVPPMFWLRDPEGNSLMVVERQD
jgi:catechol 2,3-dioxygenase-like lactoylglutathione lyase family enzyme